MVKEGVILRHKILARRIELDKAKIEVIEKFPPPNSIKGIWSFLYRVRFYRRFIKYFSKVAKLFNIPLEKDIFYMSQL